MEVKNLQQNRIKSSEMRFNIWNKIDSKVLPD